MCSSATEIANELGEKLETAFSSNKFISKPKIMFYLFVFSLFIQFFFSTIITKKAIDDHKSNKESLIELSRGFSAEAIPKTI